ncbi:hypothetical protein [Antrihabitans sp. YC2-6]|uniref:hypothetical protein n=1 Tax=Antrihabitans sp. YC2-6 TaxID=2799498 RepID=UPI0018F42346|nr:hypothetical protein [Antrihabitans sp. YC2-6]MBJ8346510.1 hypothetical protein [Antrihabitans sp. YC2-6]
MVVLIRRISAPAVAGLLLATAVLSLPGQASAAVAKLDLLQGNSNGFGASCTYTLTAWTTSNVPVTFADAAGASFTPAAQVVPTGGSATVNWTPNAPGSHLLTATQGDNVQTTLVVVGTGVNTGSTTCRVF